MFQDEMKAVRDRRKTVKLSMQLEPGRKPPTAQEVQQYQELQAQHAANMSEREAIAAAERCVTKMRSCGACSFLQMQTASGEASDVAAVTEELCAPGTDAAAGGRASKLSSRTEQGPSQKVLQLLRCKDASNVLAKRTFSLRRFITAVSIVIIRCWQQATAITVIAIYMHKHSFCAWQRQCCKRKNEDNAADGTDTDQVVLLQAPGTAEAQPPARTVGKLRLGQTAGKGRSRCAEAVGSGQNGHATWN